MVQIVNPKYEIVKHLKNLKLTIRCYDSSVSVFLNGLDGYMVFNRSYSVYDESVIEEIKNFIRNYDDIAEGKCVSLSEKMYFFLTEKLT